MAHHKRRRPKNQRAGCLMCKPHKRNKAKHAETLQEQRLEPDFKEGVDEYEENHVESEMLPKLIG